MSRTDIAIVGAGPYGLALAAHLSARGADFRILGQPMVFWQTIADAAPKRFLKSFCFGSNIPAPWPGTSFPEWSRSRGLEDFEPCSMRDFADYGQWLQEQFVPTLEPATVMSLKAENDRFRLILDSGEQIVANRVVVATGLSSFEHVPDRLAPLPDTLCRHSNAVRDYAAYRGRKVAVIGAGQSALEAAGLLREAGATPTLIVREPHIRWMTRLSTNRNLAQRIRSPLSGLGSGPKAWLLTNLPGACRRLPERTRTTFVSRHLPPEGAWWLRPRVEGLVETMLATRVVEASAKGSGLTLTLAGPDDGKTRRDFDHVVAATGFRIDVDRLSFIDADLRRAIGRIGASPRLDPAFQSSVPHLHFVGPSAAMSFGPLFRFVIGAEYTTSVLAHRFAGPLAKAA